MRVSLIRCRISLLVFMVLITGTPAHSFAGILPFHDDFEDGSATDGSPGTWLPGVGAGAGGVRAVVGGDYILSHTELASSFVEGSTTSDVSIRTQLRILETSSFVFAAVFARSPSLASYFGGIRETGEIAVGESFAGGGHTTRERVFTGLNPLTTDVLLQFDVMGDQISLTAWAAGSAQPNTPRLTFHDDTINAGPFGVFHNTKTQSKVAFRYFEAVPEPSTCLLALITTVIGVGCRGKGQVW